MRSLASIAALLLCSAACTVGSTESLPGGDDDGDGEIDAPGATPDGGGGGDGNNVACEPASTNLPNGNHNPGQACLTCHAAGAGAGAPVFTLGGTLFTTAAGATPIAGATITVVDANLVTTKLITASNGNFYTAVPVALPLTVQASKCPDTQMMGTAAPSADCNSCHQPATTGHIHLP